MEFMTGVKEKETLELSELLEEGRLGEEVKVNGAVHTIRDMGTVAFVILRKREDLVQCVYEEGVTKFNLKDLREAATVEVTGKLTESEKAPNGIEIRLSEIKDVYKRQDHCQHKGIHNPFFADVAFLHLELMTLFFKLQILKKLVIRNFFQDIFFTQIVQFLCCMENVVVGTFLFSGKRIFFGIVRRFEIFR